MTSQDEIRLKKRTVEPGDYIPKILHKHAGDMEWMNTHKEEYLKAEQEFIERITQVLDWHPNMARFWLRRAVWYKMVRNLKTGITARVLTVAKWSRTKEWYEDTQEAPVQPTTLVHTTTTPSDS